MTTQTVHGRNRVLDLAPYPDEPATTCILDAQNPDAEPLALMDSSDFTVLKEDKFSRVQTSQNTVTFDPEEGFDVVVRTPEGTLTDTFPADIPWIH